MEEKNQEPLEELKEFLSDYVKKEQAKPAAPRPASPELRRRAVTALQAAVFLLACAYIWAALPAARDAIAGARPLRQGTYATDRKTDECIKTLWGLAAGTLDPASARCPVSKAAYKRVGGGFSCPFPEKHGLSSLSYVPGRGVESFRPVDKRRGG